MAKDVSEAKSGHGGHDEVLVNETTPQGTQANGVEYGHDTRDISVGSIMRWLVGVGFGTGVIIAFLIGLFTVLNNHYKYQDEMPSPMFRQGEFPPEPRIEGFVTQDVYGRLGETPDPKLFPRAGTPDELKSVREREQAQLDSFGIKQAPAGSDDADDTDQYYRPIQITPDMVARVAAEAPKPAAGKSDSQAFVEDTPSVASGGLLPNPNRYVDATKK